MSDPSERLVSPPSTDVASPDPTTATSVQPSPWTLDRDEWADLLGDEPNYRARQIWDGLYQNGKPPWELTSLPKDLRGRLQDATAPSLTRVEQQVTPDGKTSKSLWRSPDGSTIETVLMHYPRRSTVCISSQAGCAMACGFCATGQVGFERNLSVGEIVEQVIAARHDALTGPGGPRRLSNVVYMGMGEPLANYNRVLASLRRLLEDVGLGARKITVSTVGLAPQMKRFADEGLQVGLALSLHAANDELRSELVPINRRHPIADLVDACRYFRDKTGRRVSLEWAMMDGVNDADRDASELVEVAKAARAHVNLIPLNPTPGWPTVGTPKQRIDQFAAMLERRGVNVTVRANRGTDIDAACGQLAANRPQKAQAVQLTQRKSSTSS